MRHELHSEQLTVLPKRFETRRWGGNTNVVVLNQQNFSAQSSAFTLHNLQYNDQLNLAIIGQS